MSFRTQSIRLTVVLIIAAQFVAPAAAGDDAEPVVDEKFLKTLEWRCIGPSRGGRVTAVAGVIGDPQVYYMGATGGGVWKTENAGLSWQALGDGTFKTGSVGAIAVAPSDPNVVYVGMGESCPRGNFSHGDGMYKSTDAGKTWTHIGLPDSRHIAEIEMHPHNPDFLYVAALGHIFGPNEERGVFRSSNGGASWERVLYVNDETGAIDLEMDPTNPRILYAAFWRVKRTPWSLESGGPGSGIYKSTDGGDTWKALNSGLPEGIKGKIGLAVSPVNPDRVWAIVEADDGGVFRSDDAGESWQRINENRQLRQRAWYYTHIYADPKDEETVYVLNVRFFKSTDGGRNFNQTIRVPHVDNHDLWINPDNALNMINANDGGANVTFDGGKSWTEQDNQPTAQFYHVAVDNQFPYRVYGAQQDNSTISISHANRLGRWRNDWYDVGGGESGYIAVRSDDPDIVYAGSYGGYLTRYDHETKQRRNITVWPEDPMGAGVETMKYRFQWTFPIHISPHDPNTLYVGANVVLKSTNEGQSWEVISPDLTTDDKSKQQSSGGPITKDNTGVEYYCTIFSLVESPHEPGVIWAGSDDGLAHITKDGGQTWTNVTPAGLGKWSLISLIECSPHDPATCYLAVNRYKLDDFSPYIFRTNDYGRTWEKITEGIADDAFVRAVREDPQRRGLLYAGTETGVWVSFNDGERWQPLQCNLPRAPITDLVVHEDESDLVVATQGRSFWILDDLELLRQLNDEVMQSQVHLFGPEKVYRNGGEQVSVRFYLSEMPDSIEDFRLELLQDDGEVIRTYRGKEADDEEDEEPVEAGTEPPAETEAETEPAEVVEEEPRAEEEEAAPVEEEEPDEDEDDNEDQDVIEIKAGMNHFEWNMRYPDAERVPGAVMWGGGVRGPEAPPGKYQVRLTLGEVPLTQPFEILGDPRLGTTQEEYDEQFIFLLAVRDKVDQAHKAVNEIRSIRRQVNELLEKTKDHPAADELKEVADALLENLKAVEEEIIQTRSKSSQDPLNFPIRLNDKIATLSGVAAQGDSKPTDQAYAVFEDVSARLDAQLIRLDEVIREDVAQLNRLVAEKEIPAIITGETNETDDG